MDRALRGNVAVVSGAARGINKRIATHQADVPCCLDGGFLVS